jgi:hypothetical protein
MSFKQRRARRSEAQAAANEAPGFRHASGYTDLAGVLGDHTLDAAQEAAAVAPKGYRARSLAKNQAAHR